MKFICEEGECDFDDFIEYGESYDLPGGKASLDEHFKFLEDLDLVVLDDVVRINPLYDLRLCRELSNDFESFIFRMLIEKEDKIPVRLKKALNEIIAFSYKEEPIYTSQFIAWVDGDLRDARNIRKLLVDINLLIEEEEREGFRVNGKYVWETLMDKPTKLVVANLKRLLSEKGRMEKLSVVTELVKRIGIPRRTIYSVIDKIIAGDINVERVECREMVGGLCVFRFIGE